MQAKYNARTQRLRAMALFLDKDAHILALLRGALATQAIGGGAEGIFSIQVLDKDLESSSNAMAYAVYTLVRWVCEGKIRGVLRMPAVQGE